MCFLRNLHKNPQVNPQKKLKVLVMVGLATKKIGAAQASWGWLRPESSTRQAITKSFKTKRTTTKVRMSHHLKTLCAKKTK
ncbi:hypothetical protein MTR_7g024020 [Medicago truncatula]|uniref:Uncharacterized protein n=1 Tax=Medicago truncatula TaxID=3880 RepID=G7KWR8_MEDTR|nr:hypothetical protein MTR_7g024020 [Medicago truncatula]